MQAKIKSTQKHPAQIQIENKLNRQYTFRQLDSYAKRKNLHPDEAFRHLVRQQCKRHGVPYNPAFTRYQLHKSAQGMVGPKDANT